MNGKFMALMAMLAVVLLVSAYNTRQISMTTRQLESLKGEIEYCVWHHEKHKTKIIKGSKAADKFRNDIRRKSDEGDC